MSMLPGSRVLACALFAAALLAWPRPAAAQKELKQARRLYNASMFDEAITAATPALDKPKVAASASLIIARAKLERFRISGDQDDLAAARKELTALNSRKLSAQESIEWQMGLGETLVFEDQFGPASEIFESLFQAARLRFTSAQMDKLVEWWANSTARFAESFTGPARSESYDRMLRTLRTALQLDPPARASTYWLVVASRGVGDLEGAWNAAVAGWIRAGSVQGGDQLREDLEQYVMQTVIPERARARTGQRQGTRVTTLEIAAMTRQWRTLTQLWSGSD
jgi:tetratricopeptide (TPR) repeat protein